MRLKEFRTNVDIALSEKNKPKFGRKSNQDFRLLSENGQYTNSVKKIVVTRPIDDINLD